MILANFELIINVCNSYVKDSQNQYKLYNHQRRDVQDEIQKKLKSKPYTLIIISKVKLPCCGIQ